MLKVVLWSGSSLTSIIRRNESSIFKHKHNQHTQQQQQMEQRRQNRTDVLRASGDFRALLSLGERCFDGSRADGQLAFTASRGERFISIQILMAAATSVPHHKCTFNIRDIKVVCVDNSLFVFLFSLSECECSIRFDESLCEPVCVWKCDRVYYIELSLPNHKMAVVKT